MPGSRGSADAFRWRPDPESPRAANADAWSERARAGRVRAALDRRRSRSSSGATARSESGRWPGSAGRRAARPRVLRPPRRPQRAGERRRRARLDGRRAHPRRRGRGGRARRARRARPMLERTALLPRADRSRRRRAGADRARGDPGGGRGCGGGRPAAAARAALAPLAGCDAIAVHFDVDLVDFLDAPLAENTDRGVAPSLEACGGAARAARRPARAGAHRHGAQPPPRRGGRLERAKASSIAWSPRSPGCQPV